MHPLPNELIVALSSQEQLLLMRKARLIELKTSDLLFNSELGQSLVYFITSGSVALFVSLKEGDLSKGLSVGLIGNEGAVGLQAALGIHSSHLNLIVQSPGFAYVVEARYLQSLIKRFPNMLIIFSRYLWVMYEEVCKITALSHQQDIKLRLIHWLLISYQRCNSKPLFMTHEHISRMLGVRRASISLAANFLKSKHLIDYSRGYIRSLDLAGLERLMKV